MLLSGRRRRKPSQQVFADPHLCGLGSRPGVPVPAEGKGAGFGEFPNQPGAGSGSHRGVSRFLLLPNSAVHPQRKNSPNQRRGSSTPAEQKDPPVNCSAIGQIPHFSKQTLSQEEALRGESKQLKQNPKNKSKRGNTSFVSLWLRRTQQTLLRLAVRRTLPQRNALAAL